ncbi:MAG TPA: nucleotide exchange factor GrpE [Flexivirga sp.]|uniref:nucleotide exchange factor GrpE n=1 Tax=Flexivirga sp. TaxID=1962927 RepID=UPI002B98DF2B|nr:nucleotide exchange factor GrpE [Flexivirga sp.]HWC24342.1 nucleotide exchange factor GrpE [Flexivirga sp.]
MTDSTKGSQPGSDLPGPGRRPEEEDQTGPVIRDKRRIDENGELRTKSESGSEDTVTDDTAAEQPAVDEPATAGESATEGEQTTADTTEADVEHPDTVLAAQRLEDLQRAQAEYFNYKKRVERDREAQKDATTARVLESLLPVLDDIYLAREHGDLEGTPFEKIADKLDSTLTKLGLTAFGAVGEPFDPTHHEALMHIEAEVPEGAEGTTIVQVMQPGYRLGERMVRPARVAVADPS